MKKGTKVVVTTDKDRRGVFGGVLVTYDTVAKTCELKEAHMAVYWPNQTHGVLGLASKGPQDGSRISPKVPSIELDGVTAVAEMTADAWAAWEAEPWS